MRGGRLRVALRVIAGSPWWSRRLVLITRRRRARARGDANVSAAARRSLRGRARAAVTVKHAERAHATTTYPVTGNRYAHGCGGYEFFPLFLFFIWKNINNNTVYNVTETSPTRRAGWRGRGTLSVRFPSSPRPSAVNVIATKTRSVFRSDLFFLLRVSCFANFHYYYRLYEYYRLAVPPTPAAPYGSCRRTVLVENSTRRDITDRLDERVCTLL